MRPQPGDRKSPLQLPGENKHRMWGDNSSSGVINSPDQITDCSAGNGDLLGFSLTKAS